MRLTRRKIEIAAGALIGVLVAAFLVWTWRVPPEVRNDKLGVNVVTQPSAEFEFSKGQVIHRKVGEGTVVQGSFDLRNQTPKRQKVRFRATATEPDIGKTLHVTLTAGTKTVFEGDVEGLDKWTSDPVPVESGKIETFQLQASVKRSPDGSLQGLGQDVTVSLEVDRSG